MNNFELVPTEENLINTLKKDLLRRNENLVYFYELLSSQEGVTSIALDGRWGSGKTFFVKQAMLLINAKNPMSNMDNNKKQSILKALPFFEKTEQSTENYDIAIYYDAWENDNNTDPVLSLIYEITKQLGINYDIENDSKALKLAGLVLNALTGRDIKAIIDKIQDNGLLDEIKKEKDVHENIKEFFTTLLAERGNRLVIFIDELDRCKPSYSVRLLEEIKHYLSDDNITFVFSVNLDELQHTIRHYYGNSFDSCRYLDRFFDMRICLPPADKTMFYRELGLDSGYALEKVCLEVIKTYSMELREIMSLRRQVKIAVYEPTHNNINYDFSFSEGKGKQLLMIYIVPLLVGVKMVDISLYNEFTCGRNSKPLMDVYLDSDRGERLAASLLNRNESFEKEEGKIVVTIKDKLQQLYDAIFVKDYTGKEYYTRLGDIEFDDHSKNYVKNVESMLTKYACYD